MEIALDETQELTEFFEYIWGTEPPLDKACFVYLPLKEDDGSPQGNWTKFMFAWPRQKAAVVRHVLKYAANPNVDVFYSPALFGAANPKKENVIGSWVLWVDFDGNAPTDWTDLVDDLKVPEPTLVIQSSIPGHEHTYWKLSTFLDIPTTLEERNRSLAYALHADTSGWDADQILRPPFTINRKRDIPVTIKSWA